MATTANLSATIRDTRLNPSRLRHEGKIPAVVYGHGIFSTSLTLDTRMLDRILREFGTSHLVSLTINEGQPVRVFIQELQRHPVSGTVLHVDFHQVAETEKMQVKVPIRFEGVAAAVKELGGTLVRIMNEVHVECLPADLPEAIVADITKLATFASALTVADLKVLSGVKLLEKPESVVVKVMEVKEEKIEEVQPAAGPAPEPEVVGKKGAVKDGEAVSPEPEKKGPEKKA